MDENLFELFCVKNDFAKYFEKYHNLFVYIFYFTYYSNSTKKFISILQKKSNSLRKMCCMILRNTSLAPEN